VSKVNAVFGLGQGHFGVTISHSELTNPNTIDKMTLDKIGFDRRFNAKIQTNTTKYSHNIHSSSDSDLLTEQAFGPLSTFGNRDSALSELSSGNVPE
jgi:hypothetical protein